MEVKLSLMTSALEIHTLSHVTATCTIRSYEMRL